MNLLCVGSATARRNGVRLIRKTCGRERSSLFSGVFVLHDLHEQNGECRKREENSQDDGGTKENPFETAPRVVYAAVAAAKCAADARSGLLEYDRHNEQDGESDLHPGQKGDQEIHMEGSIAKVAENATVYFVLFRPDVGFDNSRAVIIMNEHPDRGRISNPFLSVTFYFIRTPYGGRRLPPRAFIRFMHQNTYERKK